MFSSNTSQVSSAANYIEDVFSTWLYTGNAANRSITNGIDLAGKGGLLWIKSRSTGGTLSQSHYLFDSARGYQYVLSSNTTNGQYGPSGANEDVTSFNSDGFSLGSTAGTSNVNINNTTFASWTFRKQAKFFDVVTWTGDGTSNRQISHSLGSTPGCVIVKNTSSASDWPVYHRSLGFSTGGAPYNGLRLNGTNATGTYDPPISAASSTTITVTTSGSNTNQSGQTFVAYLFAHDAGGFGTAGTDNVISCGSYTGNGSTTGPTITLGYEPQWVLIKRASGGVASWAIVDAMRGMTVGGDDQMLLPNTSDAESGSDILSPRATGFQITTSSSFCNGSGDTCIYIAIRRGPMKTPTSGTSVFTPVTATNDNNFITAGFPVDWMLEADRAGSALNTVAAQRLTGSTFLKTASTSAEASGLYSDIFQSNTGVKPGAFSTGSFILWNFQRAPGFFDVVCYTGDGVNARAITHNLGVAPEMIIVKNRGGGQGSQSWVVWASGLTSRTYELYLDDTRAQFVETSPRLNVNNAPSATQFEVGTDGEVNGSGGTYVAYLFASCPGVSKVGSYSGTGATQTISCGFAARFVLIKRINSTGSWWVWDTARGMVSGTDPRLAMNSTSAETNANWVYTDASGFQIVTTDATVNASGGSYIFLAVG